MTVDETTLRRVVKQELDITKHEIKDELKHKLKQEIDLSLASFFGQFAAHFDKRTDDFEAKMLQKFDSLQTNFDNLAGRMTTDEAERAALGYQLVRHEGWINQLAKKTGTSLSAP